MSIKRAISHPFIIVLFQYLLPKIPNQYLALLKTILCIYFVRRGYDYVSFTLVKLGLELKYAEPRIVVILLNHMDCNEIGEEYDVFICKKLARERGDFANLRDLY